MTTNNRHGRAGPASPSPATRWCRARPAAALFASAAIVALFPAAAPAQQKPAVHPIPANIVRGAARQNTARLAATTPGFASVFGPLIPEADVGVLDGDERLIFGRIADVAFDSRGRLLVADDQ